MERYIDMAYLREGEEPQRWAFCTLGETRVTDGSDEAPQLAPLADGSFYPASQFRLHARTPLPFPQYLQVSRNYFNLGWVGDRRLKNAVMVLEWVPSTKQLSPLPTGAAEMSEAQQARLHAALRPPTTYYSLLSTHYFLLATFYPLLSTHHCDLRLSL